ncbi:MAG: Ig-like domain-containing protein, partial [Verrucomicrobiota bacterium]
ALATTTLSANGQTNFVTLVEQSLGEVHGAVIGSDGMNLTPGVSVTLAPQDGISSARTVTTGPDGLFSFPGVPAGPFTLSAEHPITKLRGQNSGTLPENVMSFQIDVALQPLASVVVHVVQPDGITPATNARVNLTGSSVRNADTDGSGRAQFGDLPLQSYTVRASSLALTNNRSIAQTNVALTFAIEVRDLTLVLSGVGLVNGQVFLSDGVSPASSATVVLTHQGNLIRDEIVSIANGAGRFAFSNIAVGPYSVSARSGPLGSRVEGVITTNGESDTLSITLESSGIILGRLVRADGVTPVIGEDAALTFPGRNLPGALFHTGNDGRFEFSSVPLGVFRISNTAIGFNGIARLDSTLTSNGQTNNVGDVRMDENDPVVVMVNPANTTVDVLITTKIDLLFNEALASNTVMASGIYLQGPSNTITATVQLLNDTNGVARLVRLTPAAPLKSLTTYQIIVVNGERKDALGGIIGVGPTDLVGRPLVAPFISSFTTADNDPPLLVSIFPANGAIQIDPRVVPRLSFNEPLRETNFSVTLTGPGGPVAGVASLGVNGLVLNFTPTAALPVNATFTLTASNIFDRAGNRTLGEPLVATFATLDTFGPNIATLRIADGRSPVAGSTVAVESILASSESGVAVRYTQDLNPIGSSANSPFRVNSILPLSGSTTIRAIATDRFGNDGPLAELAVNVVSNQPPAVTLTRQNPISGSVSNGQTFSVQVSASDDAGVTNLTVVGVGPLSFATNFPNGAAQSITFTVPTNAVPGALFNLIAQATDALGVSSTPTNVAINVSAATPPSLTILSPGGGIRLNPAVPFELFVASSDNSTDHTLQVVLSGGLVATQTVSVTSAVNSLVTNSFIFPLTGSPTNGASLVVTVSATDGAGNTSTISRSFLLPDLRAPQLLSA